MTQRRTIGQILIDLGRITASDVERALEYQRSAGGYLGEALVACGLVSEDEIEFGLASQFDLPYVFPKPEEIDYEAASMVSPEWALAHLTLPIMKTASALTVVVGSPTQTQAVDELRSRTDAEIQLALASPSKIRELIRQVYARPTAADEDARRPPVGMSEALDTALAAGAPRLGVSVRGARCWVWWDDAGTIRRRPLAGDWQGELGRALQPSLDGMTAGRTRHHWSGKLSRAGTVTAVDVQYLADESGSEYLLQTRPAASVEARFQPPAGGIVSEIRLLARSGSARFVVTAEPASLGHEILPHLPELFLDPSWRSIYVHTRETAGASETFSHLLSKSRAEWRSELDSLRAFRLDVVTVDLAAGDGDWITSALDVGSVAFLLWDAAAAAAPAHAAGIRWRLHVARRDGGELEWSLEPLHV